MRPDASSGPGGAPIAAATLVQPDKQRAGAEISRKALCGTCHLASYSGQNQVVTSGARDAPHQSVAPITMKCVSANRAMPLTL